MIIRKLRTMNMQKNAYENWQDIAVDVTHHSMIYVDVRKLAAVSSLVECVKLSWVQNHNKTHAPKERRLMLLLQTKRWNNLSTSHTSLFSTK